MSPNDPLLMFTLAVMMVSAAMAGTTALAAPAVRGISFRQLEPRSPATVDCKIIEVNVKDLQLAVHVAGEEKTFQLAAGVQVYKDGKLSELGALMEGDRATLTLTTAGGNMVSKVEAVSSR